MKVQDQADELKEALDKLDKMQEHLIHSEKMVSIGSLVAGVTHEVSTPIGLGITGMSHFLHQTKKLRKLYDAQEMSQDDFENYLRDAEKTADIVYTNLLNATNIIKSFKRISVDQSSEQKYKFNLGEYIDEVIISLHNKIKHTKIKVINNIDSKITLDSYPGCFAQIFTNFIMNSLIHGFKEGEEGTINIDAMVDGDSVKIDYRDDGCGIPSENINKIYEPFFTTKRNEGGSGLGLQIVHHLVTKELKGEIFVESKEGNGVHFSIVLPRELN